MKQTILLILSMVFFGNLYAQSGIVDFSSAMISHPIEKKTFVMNVIYNEDGKFSDVEREWIKNRKPTKNAKNNYAAIGKIIDSLELVDYKSDTVYVLSTYDISRGNISSIYNTSKGTFFFIKNDQKNPIIQHMNEEYYDRYYDKYSEDLKVSDFLLYKTIFAGDIDKLIRLIKSSEGNLGDNYFMSANQIILKDNQVLKKNTIYFDDMMHWKLE